MRTTARTRFGVEFGEHRRDVGPNGGLGTEEVGGLMLVLTGCMWLLLRGGAELGNELHFREAW